MSGSHYTSKPPADNEPDKNPVSVLHLDERRRELFAPTEVRVLENQKAQQSEIKRPGGEWEKKKRDGEHTSRGPGQQHLNFPAKFWLPFRQWPSGGGGPRSTGITGQLLTFSAETIRRRGRRRSNTWKVAGNGVGAKKTCKTRATNPPAELLAKERMLRGIRSNFVALNSSRWDYF